MKKRLIPLLALVLSLALLFSLTVTPTTVAAAGLELSDESKLALGKIVVKVFGAVADVAIKGLATIFPDVGWPDKDGYVSENFLPGTDSFQTGAADGAKWYAGYASESIIPDDLAEVGYPVIGNLNITENKTYDVLPGDDQCFRTVALSDGTNTVLFCTLDSYGFTSGEVRKVRGLILDAIDADDIVSINISTSHAHSCLDVHGLGASILGMVGETLKAGALRLIGKKVEVSSLNPKLMEILYEQSVKTAVSAYESMKTNPGTLSFSSFDFEDMLYDKQLPDVFDPNLNLIRFVPDGEGRDIWLVNFGCHPTKMMNSGFISSDFPGALVRKGAELANADVAFYNGAELAITRRSEPLNFGSYPEWHTLEGVDRDVFELDKFGEEAVRRIKNETPVDQFDIEPFLNIRHAEQFFGIENSLLIAISRANMVNNIGVKTGNRLMDVQVLSEVGYCELGSKLSIVMLPGEVDAEIVFGGARTAAESWNGTDWGYKPFAETVGSNRKLIAFGITNDQIGYVLPDNDFAHTFASLFEDLLGGSRNKHYEEMLSLSKTTASTLTEAFEALVKGTRN